MNNYKADLMIVYKNRCNIFSSKIFLFILTATSYHLHTNMEKSKKSAGVCMNPELFFAILKFI